MTKDVKNASDSSAEEKEEKQSEDKSLEHSGTDSDKSEGDESIKAVPYHRFKEVNDAKSQAEQIVNWYRENIGDPKAVLAFKQWQQEQIKDAEKQEAEGEITPEQLAKVRRIFLKANPEIVQLIKEKQQERTDREEGQWSDAEDRVRELASENLGLKGKADEPKVTKLGQYIMVEIQNDQELLKMWQRGNLRCIDKAYDRVMESHDSLGKSISRMKQETADKRKVAKLPTLPSAQGSLSQNGNNKREKGITKSTHDDAWALIQQSMQE